MQRNNSNPFLAYNWSFLILYRVRSCQLLRSDLIRPPKPPAKILCSLILPILQLERLGPHGPTWPRPAPLGAGTLDLHSLIWAHHSVARILTLRLLLARLPCTCPRHAAACAALEATRPPECRARSPECSPRLRGGSTRVLAGARGGGGLRGARRGEPPPRRRGGAEPPEGRGGGRRNRIGRRRRACATVPDELA